MECNGINCLKRTSVPCRASIGVVARCRQEDAVVAACQYAMDVSISAGYAELRLAIIAMLVPVA